MSVSLFGSVLLLAGCALAQPPPPPCCMARAHHGIYSENSIQGNIETIPTKAYAIYEFFYDFDQQYLAIHHGKDTNADKKNMTYYDYNVMLAYDYYLDGSCTSRPLNRPMRRPCEQPGSERWENYYLGLTPEPVKNAFSTVEERSAGGVDLTLMDVWSFTCDLLFEIEVFKSGNYPYEFGYYSQNFFNLVAGITDDGIFDIPAVCLA